MNHIVLVPLVMKCAFIHNKPHTKVAVNLDMPYFIGIFMKYLGKLFQNTKEN